MRNSSSGFLHRLYLPLPNVTIMEYTRLLDIISRDNRCLGAVIRTGNGELIKVEASDVVLATGGIGGLYRHSTNFRHLTGDAIAIAIKHGVELKDINYVQIHPTTFYSDKEEDRSFLISESVRGEGAKLYDKNGKRFVNELLPRFWSGIKKIFLLGRFFTIFTAFDDVTQTSE